MTANVRERIAVMMFKLGSSFFRWQLGLARIATLYTVATAHAGSLLLISISSNDGGGYAKYEKEQ
jgi:hypothetical protein